MRFIDPCDALSCDAFFRRLLLLLVIAFANPSSASAQIGATLDDCKKQFGAVAGTYRYNEGRTTEYVFHFDACEIVCCSAS